MRLLSLLKKCFCPTRIKTGWYLIGVEIMESMEFSLNGMEQEQHPGLAQEVAG